MKFFRKTIALCLAILMTFTLFSSAFAAEENIQDKPLIYIPGFTSSAVYDDVTNTDTRVDYPSTDAIISIVTEAFIPGLLVFAVDRDVDKLVKKVTDRVNEAFAYWFNEPTGEAKEGSGIIPEVLTEVTATSELRFSYDWRGDPIKIADELHKYIETVCELSGCEQITLGCHSLGSSIALAYLTKYGNSRVSGMIFDSPACNGVSLIGNIFTGNLSIDADGLSYFVKALVGETEYDALVSSVMDVLDNAGVLKLFTRFADTIVDALAPAVYRETIVPLLGGWLTMWSMVPDSKVEEAKKYMFEEILTDTDYSELISKIDCYGSTVRTNRTKTLKSFDAVGNFAIFSRYTDSTIPLADYAHLIGDQLIETSASSFGATTAPMGECFSNEYLIGKNPDYISPDKTVDASTCLFPEKTWFIKNSGHFETGGVTEEYYDMFLFAEEELTCDTAEIGRFTYRDDVTYTLIEDTTVPESNSKPTLIESVYKFAVSLIEMVKVFLESKFR